jgi:hypothetical protein
VLKTAKKAASQSTIKKRRTENSGSLAMEGTRTFVFLAVLAASSLLLVRASHALSGDAAKETGGRGSPRDAVRVKSPFREFIAGPGSAGGASVTDQSPDQSSMPSAGELMGAVIANELSDREQLLKWICLIEKRAGKQTLTEVQVETKNGPLFRLIAIDGAALNLDQKHQDDARIERVIKDPRPLLKLKQAEDQDEQKLQRLMSFMPQAFVYEYDGVEDNLVRVKFSPNPNYVPPTYEARVIHSLAGTILIDSEHKRLTKVAGQLINRVEFEYGLLGRVDNGTVELGRVEVGPQQWKTAFINIHFSGRAAIFKTINKEQYERRSDFRVVSSDLNLSEAKDLLYSAHLSASADPTKH